MKLTVLVENHAPLNSRCLAEHGLAFWIEDENSRVLLDTGASGILLQNAQKLGICLAEASDIVLSHGHFDHTGGLPHLLAEGLLKKKTITCHPDVWQEKTEDGDYIGAPVGPEVLERVATLRMSKKPRRVSKNLMFLGEIPRSNGFENQKPLGLCKREGKLQPDFLLDDSALVYQAKEGIFVITGCSHSGICNIISYAKTLFANQPVLGVIGGFHLFQEGEALTQTALFLQQEQIAALYPCHCISFAAKAVLHAATPIRETSVGESIIVE